MSAGETPETGPRRQRATTRLVLLVAILALAWLVADRTGLLAFADPERLNAAVQAARGVAWAAPAFVVLYAVVASLGLPGTPLTLAGGAIFGTVAGTGLNWLGATLGATGAFLLARSLGGDAVRRLLGRRAAALDLLRGDSAFLTLLRLRLIPVVPFNALNFGAGMAGVRTGAYVWSTALGIVPGTAVYTYFADALLAGAAGARAGAFQQLLIAASLLLFLSFVPALAKRWGWRGAAAVLVLVPGLVGGQVPDHGPWDAMLKVHVTDGRVDYDAFQRDPRFPTYLAALAQVDAGRLSPAERLAYWINVYNAFTIELINSRGERRSIRRINRVLGVPTKSPWAEPIVRADRRTLTLDDVEHRIIRVEFADPRIHVALVCAAIGCPPLREEAYTGAALDAQLDEQARRFFATPEKNRVDARTRTVHGSPIFTWYREDFGGTLAGVGAFWAQFVDDPESRQLLQSGGFRWVDTEYDWSLNIRRPAR